MNNSKYVTGTEPKKQEPKPKPNPSGVTPMKGNKETGNAALGNLKDLLK